MSRTLFNPFTAKFSKKQIRPNVQISFCEILTNKYHHMYVQVESFHLNGHIIGFRLHTEKLESRHKTPSSSLAVKGLIQVLTFQTRLGRSGVQLPSVKHLL